MYNIFIVNNKKKKKHSTIKIIYYRINFTIRIIIIKL